MLVGFENLLYEDSEIKYVLYVLEGVLAISQRNSQIFLKKIDKTILQSTSYMIFRFYGIEFQQEDEEKTKWQLKINVRIRAIQKRPILLHSCFIQSSNNPPQQKPAPKQILPNRINPHKEPLPHIQKHPIHKNHHISIIQIETIINHKEINIIFKWSTLIT